MNYKDEYKAAKTEYRFAKAREKEEKKRAREQKRWERQLRRQEVYNSFWVKAERMSPPGAHIENIRTAYPIVLVVSQVIFFVAFIAAWDDAHAYLPEPYYVGGVLYVTETLPGYLYLLVCGAGKWMFYLLVFFFFQVVGNYTGYYQESKSIYVMKRIPDRLEIHKRAWALPSLLLLGILLACVLTALLCMLVYLTCSPEAYLPEAWFSFDGGSLIRG